MGSEEYKNELLQELETIVNEHSKRPLLGLFYTHNFNTAKYLLLEILGPEITKVSREEGVDKAMLTAVLFRETMVLGLDDILDGNDLAMKKGKGLTIGIAQISVEGVKANEVTVNKGEAKFQNTSDEDIIKMLKDSRQSVYFAAIQLKARAIREEISIDTQDPDEIKKIFAGYNDSTRTKDHKFLPWYTKETYGEQTYQYYEIFQKYYWDPSSEPDNYYTA